MTEIVRLGDLCHTTSGGTPSRSRPEFFGGEIPWVKSGNLNDGLVYEIDESISAEGLASSSAKIFPAGTLLIAMYGATVGRLGILGREAATNQAVCGIQPNKDIDRDFLFHCLLHKRKELVGKSVGGAQPNISQAIIRDTLVPLPPLDEQRRIVGLLDRAAEIRRRADAARAKARAIIPALFLDTFGDPATNPKGWPHLPFGQITNEFRYGTNQKCHDEAWEGSVPVLRIPNVIGGQIDWSDIKHAALPAKEREKTRLRVGDLLFVRTNGNPDYIGRCAYFDAQTDASYASYLIRARLAESISPIFAIHHFNHPRFRPLMLRMGKTTAGNYNLSVEGLSALPVMVPPLALQAAFAETAQRLDSLARALDAAAAKAEAMAAALSAEVFG